ncbi:MAG: succinate dehydrogenase, cytochrome b556 subunit [Rhodospirillaceae bacterium]|jgi:succinate dehydrogenase / fumarate reductase cytochrome b subunit
MTTGQRPLSPHLQIYKPEFTSALSIFHRITGVGLALGTLLLVCWLFTLAGTGDAFVKMQTFWASVFGRVILFAWSYALFYHLCNGVRHLFWDAGIGFDIAAARRSAIVVVVLSLLMTLGAWAWGLSLLGGS